MAFAAGWKIQWPLVLGFARSVVIQAIVQAVVSHREMRRLLRNDSPRSIGIAPALGAASSSCSYAAVAITRSIFHKGANFTAAMAFEMASTNLVLKLSIIKRRHQLRRRVAFILANLIVPPILSIYRAPLRISDGANSRREQPRLDDYPNL